MSDTQFDIEQVLRLNAVFNNGITGIFIITHNGILESINPLMAKHMGKTPNELEGEDFRKFLDNENKNRLNKYIERYEKVKENPSPDDVIETIFITKEEKHKHIEISISSTYINKELYFVGIVKDTTSEKELEQEIEAQKKEKEKLKVEYEKEQALNELKTRFVSMASHEFRSPLAGLLSSINLIERYINSDTDNWQEFTYHTHIEKHIATLKKAIKNLSNTFDEFLAIGKVSEKQIELHNTQFKIKKFFEDHKEYITHLFSPDHTLIYDLNLSDTNVYMDRNFLNNILNNLISNAIKYSPSDSEIIVSATNTNTKLKIKITDHGKGIPKDQQPHIFEHFFRADNVKNYEGTGLGLTATKKYVDLMKGTILVKSEDNKGTIFIIELPLNHE